MARIKVTVTPSVAKRMVADYAKGYGLARLAQKFQYGTAIVRRTISAAGVPIRGRGRPRQ